MSLINDALKRAREAQQKNPPSGAPPLRPVEFTARGGSGWMLVAAAAFLLAAACFFIGLVLLGNKASPVAAAAAPAIPTPPSVVATPAPATNAPLPATITNARPPVAAAEQRLKIQGIIFNAARPLAIVNGKAVNAGDRVGDFQVKQILKNSVIFERPDGSQQTLAIGE